MPNASLLAVVPERLPFWINLIVRPVVIGLPFASKTVPLMVLMIGAAAINVGAESKELSAKREESDECIQARSLIQSSDEWLVTDELAISFADSAWLPTIRLPHSVVLNTTNKHADQIAGFLNHGKSRRWAMLGRLAEAREPLMGRVVID